MSVVIGYRGKDNKVYIGADSAATSSNWGEQSELLIGHGKVFKNGKAIFGVVGSCRSMQILHYNFILPDRTTEQTTEDYMYKTFMPLLIKCFKDNECAKIKESTVTFDSSVMIGYGGELFLLHCDFYLDRIVESYAAFGSGGHLATGAMCLFETQGRLNENPKNSIKTALSIACKHNAYCEPPFEVLECV